MITEGRPRLLVLPVGLGVGGAEEIIRESLPLIEAEGFEVTLWSLKEGGSLREDIGRNGARVRSLEGTSRWSPAVLGRLYRGLRRERFDLVHSHLFRANLAARLVGRAAGIRVIINSHHGTDAWRQSWARGVERATAGLADRIVTCSESVRRAAIEEVGLPPEKVVAIPNGISIRRFAARGQRYAVRTALGLAGDRPVLGTVARLDEPDKGIAVLVSAMEWVASRIPQVICLVAGDGPSRRELEENTLQRGLGERIRFLGVRRDIPDLLQALDLYVQPSLREGFGLSALEAMASGLPVIASRAGGLVEVVKEGETGELVPPGDSAVLGERIVALLQADELRRRYGRQGVLRARDCFPLDRMVREWVGLYRLLLAEKRLEVAA
ncbi:MAG TPA: glycosyltransferase [Candidatus Polarisedimenticolia bacterium]|nr:glycosyltransferase [Candidatus Polarisedimenticolia bacterium]